MSTYTPIASQTLGSATSSVSFTSIPQGYTDLVVVIGYKAATTNYPTLRLTFNGSATGYSGTQLYGDGATAGSARTSNAAYISIARAYGVPQTIGNTGTIIINLQNYSNTTTYKTVLARANASDTGTEADVGLWQNTSAITSFSIDAPTSNDFASGSTFTLHGIAVGNSSAKADGGSSVTTDGTYYYHTFKSSGAFIPRQALTVDYLVVAGGGGGGSNNGAGAGAGGLRSTVTATGGGGSLESALSLTAGTSYTVTVGAGGAGSTNLNIRGAQGADSVFSTITSIGGGGGASDGQAIGGDGGSSGGGCNSSAAGTRTASPVQGFNGGASNVPSAGGGGGGAGAAGAITPSANNGGNGGNGAAVSITGSSVTYAGGGGGGGRPGGSNSTGGSGGGGAGSATVAGTAGTTNTGGGGGAGGNNAGTQNGGNGGSGIVIIRYLA